eukprot:gene9932-7802_t
MLARWAEVHQVLPGEAARPQGAEVDTFTKCIIILAKSLSTPSLFKQEVIEDVSFTSDQDREQLCHSRQTVQALTSWLRNLTHPLINEDLQEWMVEQLLQPVQVAPDKHFALLRSAFSRLPQSSICILRPLIIFLQQYALRQVEYNKQLQQLAAWASPIVFPSVTQRNAMHAQLAISILVSQAMKIFYTMESTPQPPAIATARRKPVPLPAALPAEAAFPKQSQPESLMEQVFALEEACDNDETFKPVLTNMVSIVVMGCLFNDDDDLEVVLEEQAESGGVGVEQVCYEGAQERSPMVDGAQENGRKRMRFLSPLGTGELEEDPNSTRESERQEGSDVVATCWGNRSAHLPGLGLPGPWSMLTVQSGKTASVPASAGSTPMVFTCMVQQPLPQQGSYPFAHSTPQSHCNRSSLAQPGTGLSGQLPASDPAALGTDEELSGFSTSSCSSGSNVSSSPEVTCGISYLHTSRCLVHPQAIASNLCL